uniref:Small nuclear RNA activating complex, polypeptide 4 n=1 Tax=Oreochromis aureus TaxID=47969 RepID=A0A668SSN9_OREAU
MQRSLCLSADMSASLSAKRDKIQREVEELERSLSVTNAELELLSSGTGTHLLSLSLFISDLGLSPSVDSCLQMNLVYQQVVQETLDQLEKLLTQNQKEQKELETQLSGRIKEPSKQQPTNSSYQQPMKMYLGRFLKPYFKDKLTGLGPPANQEAKEKTSRIAGYLDDKKLKIKRWESWQKTLLIHYVQQFKIQKKEEELIGDRFEEYDWQKISNIDFEETRDAGDIRCFWQNFLHPSINKTRWSQEEVQQLKEISRKHKERHWEIIAQELGTGRTAFMCLQMFQRFVSGSLKRGSWTPAEDDLLRELVDKMRIGNFIPYTQMSYFMEGRDPAQLIYRWNQVLDPSLKRGPWTKQEDKLLLQAVARHGEKNWWKIRLEVPGRTDGGCRDRYYDCLKAGTKRGPFDRKERELLLELVEKHGVGHWAKIASEIPNRIDAQCMRTWRQMSKAADEVRDLSWREGNVGVKKKKAAKTNNNIRRRLKAIKEEVISEEEEEEEMAIEYMDSDDEKKKKMKKTEVPEVEKLVEVQEEQKEEELEEEYTFPPMQEWIPVERAQPFTFLNFRPVVLASSNESHNDNLMRSTILGKSGRSVIIGPHPREVRWEERHDSGAMMMVSPDQLRAHLHNQARRFYSRSKCKTKTSQTSRPLFMKGMTGQGVDLMLQAAVTPWIGNLLIPASTKRTAADVLRERVEKKELSSTSVFTLFLRVMNVDVMGCKEMIERRQSGVTLMTPPSNPPPGKFKNPNTVAGILQRMHLGMQERSEADRWCRQTPPSQLHPSIVTQVPPNMRPQVAPLSCHQPVSIPHSDSQLNAAFSPAQHTSRHAGVTISPFALPAACQRQTTTPVFVVSTLQNVSSTCNQQAVPLTSLPPFLNQPVSISPSQTAVLSPPACSRQLCLSPSTLNLPRGKKQTENHESQNGVVHASVKGEVSMSEDRKKTSNLSQKARAPRQVTKAQVTFSDFSQSMIIQKLLFLGLRPIAPKLSSVPVPITLPNQPHPLPEPPICNPKPLALPSVQPSDLDHGHYSLPFCPPLSSTNFSPRGTVRVDAPQSRPLRKEVLEIDPSLMFLEPPAAINDWLSGSGGVVIPGMSLSLPYLPPFVSNLSTLSGLLCAKKSLTRSSLQLKNEEEEEEELVAAVRQLVAERFSNNPAYQLLKARFLSCFTLPALLATMPPVPKAETYQTNQEEEREEEVEEEGEEEVELRKIKEMAKLRRAEVGCVGFSGSFSFWLYHSNADSGSTRTYCGHIYCHLGNKLLAPNATNSSSSP